MSRTALGLVGAVVGSFIPGVGPGLGFSIGSAIGGLLFPGSLPTIEGPRLTDLRVQTSSYGEPIVEVYGTIGISGNVIWAKDIEEVRTETTQGGKSGPSQTTVSYSYFGHFAVGLCDTVEAVTRIWADGKIIYDTTPDNTGAISRFSSSITIYTGTETQLPDPSIEADRGAGNVPAHRGMCYVVFDRFPLADFANHIPNIFCEVTTNAAGSFPLATIPAGIHGADRFWFSHDGRFIYAFRGPAVTGPVFDKVDSINNRFLGHFDLPHPDLDFGFLASAVHVSNDGDIWSCGVKGFTTDCVKFSSPNYNVDINGSTDSNNRDGEFILAGGTVDDPVIYGLAKPAFGSNFWVRGRGELSDLDLRAALDLKTMAGGNLIKWLAPAPNGNCWVQYAAGWFFNVDRVGSILKTVTLTALDAAGHVGRFIFLDEGAEGRFLIHGASDSLVKWDIATDAQIGAAITDADAGNNNSAFHHGLIDGFFYLEATTNLVQKIDHSTMTVVASWDPDDWISPGFEGFLYDKHSHALWGPTGDTFYKLLLDRETTGTVTLQSIVDDRLQKAGLSPSDYDTSALAGDVVRGYAVTGRMSARKALEPLAQVYFFDLVESDFKLKAVKRGAASAASIPQADLAAHAFGSEAPPELPRVHKQEIELHERIDVTYINPATNYETGTQHAKRIAEAVSTNKALTINLPVVLSDTEAKQVAERLLFLDHLESESADEFLSQKWLLLDSSDVIDITKDGVQRNYMIQQTDDGADLIRKMRLVKDDQTIYTSIATGNPSQVFPQTVTFPSVMEFFLIDSPLFQDSDSGPGFYIVASGYSDSWPGGVIYVSNDGVTWIPLVFISNSAQAVMGRANAALADGPTTVFDEVNTINVSLLRGTLTSATKTQVLDGANPCIIGDEILQYRDATQQADGSWTLSGLVRGRRGTEWATGTHSDGDRFATLVAGKVTRIGMELADIGAEKFYRAVTLSDPIEGAAQRAFTNTGRSLQPYAPADLKATRNSSGDITFTWKRATRLGGEWRDFVEVGLGETSENYDLIIMNGATEVRTISVTAQTAGYTSAEQTTDFGADQSAVLVNLYQMSVDIGRGFVSTATL